MRQPGRPNQGDDLQNWFQSIPLVTKTFVVGTFIISLMETFGMLNPMSIVFYWPAIKDKFQIWRLLTSYWYAGKFSFPFAMHLYALYENCRRYETNPFNTGGGGTTADFIWMVFLGMLVFSVVAFVFDLMVLSECMLYMIMYVWSRREPEALLNIMGFKFQSIYLPWVYVAIRLLMGGSIMLPLVGVAVGHLFFFCVEVLPAYHGIHLVRTPKFCMDITKWYTGGRGPTSTPGFTSTAPPGRDGGSNRRGEGAQGQGYNWGRGNVLGAN